MIGKTVSHYEILEELGGGGMGVVYRAEDLKLKRPVALKFLPPELTRDQDAKKRFIHEAQAASALQHHNICTIHEIDETSDGQLFIAMDCYDGETLKQKIATGALPVGEALDIALQAAEGLAKAHGAGMVHRDIKPANIMVTRDGEVKILDFGLAKLAGQTKVTRTGTTLGTVAYMSPEQAQGAEVDARSDIFSLGAVLYEVLTGEVPFPGEHEAAVLYGIMHTEAKPLSELRADVPEGLQGAIDKALKKDPKERYQNVLEFRDDLEAVSEVLGGAGTRLRRGTSRTSAARKGPPTRRIVAAVTALVVIAVVASIFLPRFWKSGPAKATHALAVMDFRDLATPSDPTVSAGITELVNIGLIQADIVRVVSSDLLHDLRRRLFGSPRGQIEESQTIEIARKAQATMFLTGTIRPSGAGKLVTWRLVDVRSGDDMKAGRSEGIDLSPLVDQIIGEVLPLVAQACDIKSEFAPTAVEGVTTNSPRAYQHYIAGLLAKEEWRRDDAIEEFERAVTQDSNFALAYLELGRMHSGTFGYRDFPRAQTYIEKAWTLKSRLGIKDEMRLEAQRHEVNNRTGDEIAVLREIRKRWPDDRQALIDLEAGLYWRWYFTEALAVDEEGRRLYPDDAAFGGRLYSAALAALGRSEEALHASLSYVKRHPNEQSGWAMLGQRYLDLGRPDSAEAAFHKGAELDSKESPELFSYCAYQRGDVRGAIAVLDGVLGQKNLSAARRRFLTCSNAFYLHLAALYMEEGCLTKAGDLFSEYMAKPDADVCALLLATGRARELLDICDQFDREGNPVFRSVSEQYRGRALADLGDTPKAEAAARKILEQEFDLGGRARFQALRIRTEVALSRCDPKTALELLRTVEENGVPFPFGGFINIDYRTTLARAYRMAGRLDEAANVHKEMLRIYGGYALSHYELGTIYEEMKRPTDAKKEYTKFLEMWSQADEGLPQLVDARKRLAAL
jgi:tetratricopeptide (TPR) repeat protein/TolB-like protein